MGSDASAVRTRWRGRGVSWRLGQIEEACTDVPDLAPAGPAAVRNGQQRDSEGIRPILQIGVAIYSVAAIPASTVACPSVRLRLGDPPIVSLARAVEARLMSRTQNRSHIFGAKGE